MHTPRQQAGLGLRGGGRPVRTEMSTQGHTRTRSRLDCDPISNWTISVPAVCVLITLTRAGMIGCHNPNGEQECHSLPPIPTLIMIVRAQHGSALAPAFTCETG